MSSQPPTDPTSSRPLPGPVRPHPRPPRPQVPGGLGGLGGGATGGHPGDPGPHDPPADPAADPAAVVVTVFGMLAPSARVLQLGHGRLDHPQFVSALPDLDSALDSPTRSWPVRVVISWPSGGSQVLETHEITAFALKNEDFPEGPRWGLELATESAAPRPGPSGPGVPASIFCRLWPWASFCQ